jgi:exopolysaccharide production protein ExoQ
MLTPVVLLLAGVLLALIVANPFAGLCLTFASVPILQSMPAAPFASSLTAVLGGLTFGSWLVRVVANRELLSLSGDRTYGWIFAFGTAAMVSLAFAVGGDITQGISTYVQLAVLVWLTEQLATTERRIEVMMIVCILALVAAQLIGLAGFDFSTLGRENRLAGLSGNPNELAFYSVMGICFALYFFLNSSRTLLRALLVAALALGTLSVLLSASRGGFLVLVTVVFFALFSLRLRFVRGLRISGMIFLFVAALLLTSSLNLSFVPSLARDIPGAVSKFIAGSNSEARARITRWGLRSWAEHPVFGVGFGVGAEVGAYSGSSGGGNASHSSYLTALVETGAVGFILFCGLLLATWRNLSRRPPDGRPSARGSVDLRWAWRAAFLAWLMMSLTGSLILSKVLWIIIGASISLRRLPDILKQDVSGQG